MTAATPPDAPPKVAHLDLKKDTALTVLWADGRVSVYPILYLRRMSPSADARQLREEMASNPLTVLPASAAGGGEKLTAVGAELVGNYAVKIRFSDGHDTGIYSWRYLRDIDPNPALHPCRGDGSCGGHGCASGHGHADEHGHGHGPAPGHCNTGGGAPGKS